MPEGPSIVIAREEMAPAIGKKVNAVLGNSKLPIKNLDGQILQEIATWGKHLLLVFSDSTIKIHFLLFGSYTIDEPKENRSERLFLKFPTIKLYFYSCSIRFLEEPLDQLYDWTADVLSISWDENAAFEKIIQLPEEMICDVLLDQSIFAGVGNIIKNEVLYSLQLKPERKVKSLKPREITTMIRETVNYSYQFYEWKKRYVLKKNWQIMRKKTCPSCGRKVIKKETGKRKRLSHYCAHCQH